MLLVYVRGHSLESLAVRAASWFGPWSHLGIVTQQDTVIHCQVRKGVVEEPWDEFISGYSARSVRAVPCESEDDGIAWARRHIGCGYDYGAIINAISSKFGRRPSEDRYQCAEFVEYALKAAGRSRFRPDVPLSSLTVHQSYIVE